MPKDAPLMIQSLRSRWRDAARQALARNDLAVTALVVLLVAGACLFSNWTRPAGPLSAFWPANAILLGTFVRMPRAATPRNWLAAVAAYIVVDLAVGRAFVPTLLLTAGNVVGVAVGHLLYARVAEDHKRLRQPASVTYLVAITAAASAAAGCIGMVINPIYFTSGTLQGWFFWFASELVNYIAILPAILLFPTDARERAQAWRPGLSGLSLFTATPFTALLLSFAAEYFVDGPAAIVFVAPALLWCAVVYNPFITALLTLGATAWTLFALSSGYLVVPFDIDEQAVIVSLRLGVTLIALAPLTVASLMAARETLMRRLQETNEALIKADRAKDQFLAAMSHELRTPLTGVLGMADLLVASGLSEKQTSYVATLARSARALHGILNDILDFSKIEAGHLHLEAAPFLLSDTIHDVRDLFMGAALEKAITLEVALAEDMQDAVIGDSARLRQVLSNLVGNAVKFTERGGVRIAARQQPHPRLGLELRIDVTDSGIGIPPDRIDQLFKPFVQADAGTARKFGGTGLGLVICRNIVRAMGGEITVSSTAGEGSTFSFTAHLAPDPGARAALPPDAPAPEKEEQQQKEGKEKDGTPAAPMDLTARAAPAARPLHVLVADDDATMRMLIFEMLREYGHTVGTVDNGAAAVAALQADAYDVLLLDMHMPVMDGPTTLREIRALETGGAKAARTAIIALTGDIRSEQQEIYRCAGADAVFGKPVDWDRLFAEMHALAGRGPGVHGAAAPARDALDTGVIEGLRAQIGSEMLDPLLAKFASSLTEHREGVAAAHAAGDLVRVRQFAHVLRGLAGQFGAAEVGRLASALEAPDLTIEETGRLLPRLAAATAAVQDVIHRTCGIAA